MNKISIPFRIKDIYEGLAESDGVVSLTEDSLIIELQTKDAIFGVLKSALKTITLPMKEIADVELKRSLFGDTLIIRAVSMRSLLQVPKNKHGEVILSVQKKHRELVDSFVAEAKLGIAEARLRDVEGL